MPAVSIITKRVDFSNMVFTVGGASIKYGNFITAIVNFLIIAFSIFVMITYLNKLNKKMESLTKEEAKKLEKKYGNLDDYYIDFSNRKEEKEIIKNITNIISDYSVHIGDNNQIESSNVGVNNEN